MPVARQYYAQVVCVALRLAVAAWGAPSGRQYSNRLDEHRRAEACAAVRTINVLVALQRTCRSTGEQQN